jgi:predicted trehalose synthase
MGTPVLADDVMFLTRHIVAVSAALLTGVAAASADGQPQAHALMVTCTNPASGAIWQISIDYSRATVDANPARISPAQISWHDAKDGGNYTLDRRSGDLTVILASSTGGYFLHQRCALPP